MISPCVVIATDQRKHITTINIKQLIGQGVKVVLVVSDTMEKEYYEGFDIHVVMAPNNPLGAKWQAGINAARQHDPSHIVITGSDDLLSIGFFKRWCDDRIFVGFKQWRIWYNSKLYLLQYNISQPLGGGRVYSKSILQQLDYKLFDTTRTKLLDDKAWKDMSHYVGINTYYEPDEILAIKGHWPVMNKVDLNHRNVKLLATYEGEEARQIMSTKFNYEP